MIIFRWVKVRGKGLWLRIFKQKAINVKLIKNGWKIIVIKVKLYRYSMELIRINELY